MTRAFARLAAAMPFAWVASAPAQEMEIVGAPSDWQWGFQLPSSPIMERVASFYDVWLLPMMLVISGLVLALMLYILLRFNRRANPEPSRNTHNAALEAVWTLVPVVILIAIAIPSLRLLYYQERIPETEMTLKVTGHQWYWSYEYPDHGGISFDALMVEDADLQEGQPRLLATDRQVYLPVDTGIRVQVTSEDVIHAWALPAAGVKMDAVPGRLNEMWLEIDRPGVYYGQCSELCGQLHGFMPIEVVAVERDRFDDWVAERQAALDGPAVELAFRR